MEPPKIFDLVDEQLYHERQLEYLNGYLDSLLDQTGGFDTWHDDDGLFCHAEDTGQSYLYRSADREALQGFTRRTLSYTT